MPQTLLSSCARAATAEETSFRIDHPNSRPRSTRIIALDEAAAEIMRSIAEHPWNGAHFATYLRGIAAAEGFDDLPVDALLRAPDGAEICLGDEIKDADSVIMIASSGLSGDAAGIVGTACFELRIMATGLIVTAGGENDAAARTLASLRPYASMLVVASGVEYVPEMLTALRA